MTTGSAGSQPESQPDPQKHGPERLAEAVDRLTAAGYDEDFVARPGALQVVSTGRRIPLEDLRVDEIVRFEGPTDPGDEAILCAVRARDGSVRGTYVAPYGPHAEPHDIDALRHLEETSGNA